MKILIATGIYPPDIGGPATYSETLARELLKLGHQITVVTYFSKFQISNFKFQNDSLNIVRVVRACSAPLRYLMYALKTLWWGRKSNCIYAQDSVSAGFPAMLANLILRRSFIVKVVGDYAWEQGQNKYGIRDTLDEFLDKKYDWKIELMRWIEKIVAKRAKLIITPSNYLKGVVQKWGISANKIEVIYNSFDWKSVVFPKVSTEIPDHDIIYSVGRLVPWKGFDTLIEVMADLVKEKPKLELLIYGDGPLKEDLRLKINDLGLEKSVRLLGRIDHAELLKALQGERKFFVLNSSYEGMSHQILESQAVKVPCAVSRVGGNPEIVEDGKTGLLFEYNNKEQIKNTILKLLNNDQLVKGIQERARQQIIDRHDFNKMIEKTIAVIRSVAH